MVYRCARQIKNSFVKYRVLKKIPGGAKKHPKICVDITALILYGDKFPFAYL